MAQILANEIPVASMTLGWPRHGAWVALLDVLDDSNLGSSIDIDINGGELTLSGTVQRGEPYQLDNKLRVVGGAGGLARDASPRDYSGGAVLVRSILGDLMNDAGETLAAGSSASVTSKSIDAWTTLGISVGRMLTSLLEMIDPTAVWRTAANGEILVTVDSYPEYSGTFDILDRQTEDGSATLNLLAPTLEPGMAVDGLKVSYVAHIIGEDSFTKVWLDA